MKKTIQVASLGMILGFAIALANADESTTPSAQQPGASGSGSSNTVSNTGTGTGTSANTMSDTTASSTDWKNMKSCTDQNGVTFRTGEKGFSKCIDWMKKNHKDQSGTMGTGQPGTAGTDSTSPGTGVYDSGSPTGTGTSPNTESGSPSQ